MFCGAGSWAGLIAPVARDLQDGPQGGAGRRCRHDGPLRRQLKSGLCPNLRQSSVI